MIMSSLVKVIEESGRETVMRDIHRPVKGVSKGWEEHSLQTLIRLIKNGDEHAKAERLLLANLEITAPRFVWQEFDTYQVGVIKGSSESTMYTLLKELEQDGDLRNLFYKDTTDSMIAHVKFTYILNKELLSRKQLLNVIKANLPEGFLQTRTRVISYQTLRRIYRQRKHHKLEWWNEFFNELLPQLRERQLILETWNLKNNHRDLLLKN